ncbi:hypothetical protein LUZ63_013708 [Rhynchospora breviuscula]|uniref:RING-type domain-containing protein n=1 Tax=Rhynchospora breviuscula TaxID=2022672 RepID=A0A9Q0C953_9POAL|nr:hypothetical protein LUZ63_013708 [Rhynchospora breviuscula]
MSDTHGPHGIAPTVDASTRPMGISRYFVTADLVYQIHADHTNKIMIPLICALLITSGIIILCIVLALRKHNRSAQDTIAQATAQATTQPEHLTRGLSLPEIEIFPVSAYRREDSESPTRHDSDNNSVCSICLEEFQNTQTVRTLSCSHFFHASCIDKWLGQKGTCPLCVRQYTQDLV